MSSMTPVSPLSSGTSASEESYGLKALELGVRFATPLVLNCYALGYLILVLNENAHGFVESSLFKPRAVTAGAIFILITVLPISITEGTFFRALSEPESARDTFARWFLGLGDYATSCLVAALTMRLVFIDDLHTGTASRARSGIFLAIIYLVTINGLVRRQAKKHYQKWPIAWTMFGFVSLLVVGVGAYYFGGTAIMRCLAWMFGITFMVNPWLADIRRGIKLKFKVPVLASVLLVAISLYSLHLFPYMKSTFGGGAPLPASVYMSKDSAVYPSQKVKVAVLEASDSGFYVIFEGDNKTTYIPKAAVAAIEFPTSSKDQ